MNKLKRNFSNYSLLLSLSSLLWRPTQLYLKGRGEGRGKKNWGTLSRGFGLRSFRPEISAWGVFVGRRFRPEEFLSAGDFDLGRNLLYLRPKTPHFQRGREGVRRGGGGVNGFKYCLVKDRSKLLAAFVSAAVHSAANKLWRHALCAFIFN